jgi:cytochrome c553
MRIQIQRGAWITLVLAVLALATATATATAQQERAAVIASKPDQVHGAELFGQCIACHGADGSGEMNGITPRIAGQHFRVLVKQLVDFRYGKRWDSRMGRMADRHHLAGAQDIADVASYVSNLVQSRQGGIGSGEFAAEGGRLFKAQCQSCHGAHAEGTEEGVPRLAGQHYAYLMRQMYDAVDGRRPAMSRQHSKRMAAFDFEQVRALSDYLARIGWHNEETSAPAGGSAR